MLHTGIEHLLALPRTIRLGLVAVLLASGCTAGEYDSEQEADLDGAEMEDVDVASSALTTTSAPFTYANWTYKAKNNTFIPTNTSEMTFIPETQYNASAVALYNTDLAPPYTIQFKYSTWDSDGGTSSSTIWHSADGVALILGKNKTAYSVVPPPTGQNRGFITSANTAGGDASGYAVHFQLYPNSMTSWQRGVLVQKGDGSVVSSVPGVQTYTSSTQASKNWFTVKAEVGTTTLKVYLNGALLMNLSNLVVPYGVVGIGTATGGANSEHIIKDFTITK